MRSRPSQNSRHRRLWVHGLILVILLVSGFALYSRLVPSFAPDSNVQGPLGPLGPQGPQGSSDTPNENQNGGLQTEALPWRDYFPNKPLVKYFTGGFENGGYVEIYAHTAAEEILLYNLNGAVNTVQLVDFNAEVPQIYVLPIDEAASKVDSINAESINADSISADYISPYPIVAYRDVLKATEGRPLYTATATTLKKQSLVKRTVGGQEVVALELTTSETSESRYIQRFGPGLGLISAEFWTYDDQGVGTLFIEDALVHSAKPDTLSFNYSTRKTRFPYAHVQQALRDMDFTNPQFTMLWDYGATSEWLVLETDNKQQGNPPVNAPGNAPINAPRLHRVQLGLGAFPLKRTPLEEASQAIATDAASRFAAPPNNNATGPLQYTFVGSGYEHTGYGALLGVAGFRSDGSSVAALYDLQGEDPVFIESFTMPAMAQSVFPDGLEQSLVIVDQYIVYMSVNQAQDAPKGVAIYRAYSREGRRFVADFPIDKPVMPIFPLSGREDGIVMLAQYQQPAGENQARLRGIGFNPQTGTFIALKP